MCMGKAGGIREPEKEKFSLVKRKTNNDMINEMSVEEKAEFIYKVKFKGMAICKLCVYENNCFDDCNKTCKDGIKQWLEREVEE